MGASLEMNDSHTIKIISNIQTDIYHIKTTDMIVGKTIFDLYTTFDNARA